MADSGVLSTRQGGGPMTVHRRTQSTQGEGNYASTSAAESPRDEHGTGLTLSPKILARPEETSSDSPSISHTGDHDTGLPQPSRHAVARLRTILSRPINRGPQSKRRKISAESGSEPADDDAHEEARGSLAISRPITNRWQTNSTTRTTDGTSVPNPMAGQFQVIAHILQAIKVIRSTYGSRAHPNHTKVLSEALHTVTITPAMHQLFKHLHGREVTDEAIRLKLERLSRYLDPYKTLVNVEQYAKEMPSFRTLEEAKVHLLSQRSLAEIKERLLQDSILELHEHLTSPRPQYPWFVCLRQVPKTSQQCGHLNRTHVVKTTRIDRFTQERLHVREKCGACHYLIKPEFVLYLDEASGSQLENDRRIKDEADARIKQLLDRANSSKMIRQLHSPPLTAMPSPNTSDMCYPDSPVQRRNSQEDIHSHQGNRNNVIVKPSVIPTPNSSHNKDSESRTIASNHEVPPGTKKGITKDRSFMRTALSGTLNFPLLPGMPITQSLDGGAPSLQGDAASADNNRSEPPVPALSIDLTDEPTDTFTAYVSGRDGPTSVTVDENQIIATESRDDNAETVDDDAPSDFDDLFEAIMEDYRDT